MPNSEGLLGMRVLVALGLALGAAGIVAALAQSMAPSADLKALWTAGEFWKMGRLDQIYPATDGLFTMRPPSEWQGWLEAQDGLNDRVYPYLYPPIWAVLSGTVMGNNFHAVSAAALWINGALLALTATLAIRAARVTLDPVVYILLVMIVFLTTQVASVGFVQGQPHILVTFLIVLALERGRAGKDAAAGVALGLAAAIKVIPAIYVVIWIARGQWRAVAGFAVVGGGIAVLSILVAGWPLHAAFLDTIRQIGRTLLVTGSSMNFDSAIGRVLFSDHALPVSGPKIAGTLGQHEAWVVIPRPAWWAALMKVGLVAVLIGSGLAARRMSEARLYGGLWPFMLTASVLFAPIGWIYYLLPAAVFAPVMLVRVPFPRGAALFIVGVLFLWVARLKPVVSSDVVAMPTTIFYVLGAMVWALGFALSARDENR